MKPVYFFTDQLLAKTVIPLLPRRTTPNQITTFRFLTVPVVFFLLIFGSYFWAGIVFLVAAFSDALDGALARTTDRITDWGKLFDPLADKLLIGGTAAILVTRFLSLSLAAAIVSVELVLILLAYYHKYYHHREIQANYLGKTKMVFQSVGLIVLFIAVVAPLPGLLVVSRWLIELALFFAVLSFFGYRSI
mgnify:CR=1 FL=1